MLLWSEDGTGERKKKPVAKPGVSASLWGWVSCEHGAHLDGPPAVPPARDTEMGGSTCTDPDVPTSC